MEDDARVRWNIVTATGQVFVQSDLDRALASIQKARRYLDSAEAFLYAHAQRPLPFMGPPLTKAQSNQAPLRGAPPEPAITDAAQSAPPVPPVDSSVRGRIRRTATRRYGVDYNYRQKYAGLLLAAGGSLTEEELIKRSPRTATVRAHRQRFVDCEKEGWLQWDRQNGVLRLTAGTHHVQGVGEIDGPA